MRLGSIVALVVLIFVSSLAAFGADSAAYPGARLSFQMNLTDKDFLPALKEFLPAIPGIIQDAQKSGKKIDGMPQLPYDEIAKAIVDSLAGLKTVTVTGYDLQPLDTAKITQFYAEKMSPAKGWNRLLMVDKAGIALGAYSTTNADQLFGFVTYPKGYITVQTSGKIDVAKFGDIVSKILPSVTGDDHNAISGCQGTDYGAKGFDNTRGITWELHGSAHVTTQHPNGKNGWEVGEEISESQGNAPSVPELIVKTKQGTITKQGYGKYEIPGETGQAIYIITVEPFAPAK